MTEDETREKILNTAVKLLSEDMSADKITTRFLAKEAGVNAALINYHFHSKEELLAEAAGICMGRIAGDIFSPAAASDDPRASLKQLIKNIADFSVQNQAVSRIGVISELKSGSEATSRIILPLLRQIFGPGKSESELRLIGLLILIPLQVMALDPPKFATALEVDLSDSSQRDELIDRIIDIILNEK